VIEARGISHTFPGGVVALRGVDLTLRPGEAVALMGETGAGKSTLAQILAGLLRPSVGQVRWAGRPGPAGPWAPAGEGLRVAYLFQEAEHQLFEPTVWEDVAFGPRQLGLPGEVVQARVEEALALVGFDPEAIGGRSPFTLSGGEQRRAALAGLLATDPHVLILDEPTTGLDPAGVEGLIRLLHRLHREGMGLVVITHSLEEVAGWAERLLILHQGRLVVDEPLAQAVQRPEELARWGVEPPATLRLASRLRARGLPVPLGVTDPDALARAIAHLLDRGQAAPPGRVGGPPGSDQY